MSPPRRRRRGLSLIETLVAIIIMAGASILYASMWKAQLVQRATVEQIGTAMSLYLRQVELIQSQDPRGAGAYTETNFGACPPFNYAALRSPSNQLEPPQDPSTILTSLNSYLIPAGSSWLLPLPANLVAQGYTMSVRASRVRIGTDTSEERLIKYNIRVNINDGGTPRNIITGEIFREVQ